VKEEIRVLVVDDSFFMRTVLSDILSSVPHMVVAGTARNGREAVAKTMDLRPDVITMDLDMPGMGGLEAVERIMSQRPTPIVVVSAYAQEGAQMTIRALEAGAVDFVPKPQVSGLIHVAPNKEEFLSKVKQASLARIADIFKDSDVLVTGREEAGGGMSSGQDILVAIGASAGGPKALAEIFRLLPGYLNVPMVVVQHMPEGFTESLAERLDTIGEISVREAKDGDCLQPGVALVAPGGRHMVLRKEGDLIRLRFCHEPGTWSAKPSIDLFMRSAVEHFGGCILAVVLTGMGKDGALGSRLVYEAGGRVLAQDEATSIVYGMPRSVVEMGCVDHQVSIHSMAREILKNIDNMKQAYRT